MFVAHHLLTVDKTFRKKLAAEDTGIVPAEAPNMSSDLVPKVRKLGNEAFTKHVTGKKERLTEYLQDTHGRFGQSECLPICVVGWEDERRMGYGKYKDYCHNFLQTHKGLVFQFEV